MSAQGDATRLSRQRLSCLAALAGAANGLTPHETVALTPCAYPHTASTRFSELRDLGLAVRTADKRPTPTGGLALVWQVTDLGRRTLNQHTGREQ